jgi:tetratricopeptide (TPR) repeat protein
MNLARLLPIAALSSACAGAALRPAPSAAPARATVVSVPRQVVTPADTTDIATLFERGEARARSGDLPGAAADLDRAHELDPTGPLARDALFRAAEAWDLLADHERALQRYEEVARRHPSHELGRLALVRAVRLLCHLERWQRAGELAELFLTRERAPGTLDAVVAHGGIALALVARGDDSGALRAVERGRELIESHGLDRAGQVPRDLAQLYYALGEVRRLRAERIGFSPLPGNFVQLFEQRCQLILDAQSAYSDAMRAHDSHWSAMAGFRVGELYQTLHTDVMRIEPPRSADTDRRRQLFEGALRLRYAVLLSKAKGMMEHTLAMAHRTGEASTWVERAEQARVEIERAQVAEQAALDRLPFARAELEAALSRLARGQAP